MKKYLIAASLLVFAAPAYADGISCPEMANIIADYEHKKQSGHMTKSEKETVPSILAADYQSYYSGGCTEADLKSHMQNGEKFKSKKEVK